MKLITFGSFGGLTPDILSTFPIFHQDKAKARIDQQIISYIEKFKEVHGDSVNLTSYLREDPTRFFFSHEGWESGIFKSYYLAWASSHNLPAVVCINKYDEENMKVEIVKYDGSESLQPYAEHKPVEGVQGLYSNEG